MATTLPLRIIPQIRNEEACFRSSALAVELATKYGAQLHVAHLTTARELQLFGHHPLITAEDCDCPFVVLR